MRKKMALLICLGVGISSSHVEAITTWGRFSSMLKWGLGTGIVAYGVANIGQENDVCACPLSESWELTSAKKTRKSLKIGGIVGGLTSVFTLWITGYWTPTHRLNCAHKERAKIENTTLFNHVITSDNIHQISMTTGAESSPLPLVILHLELAKIDSKLSNIKEELEKALNDVYEYSDLAGSIKCFLNQTNDDLARIRHSEYVVKNDDQKAWENQWAMHQGTELKQQQIAIEREKAHAYNSQVLAMWLRR